MKTVCCINVANEKHKMDFTPPEIFPSLLLFNNKMKINFSFFRSHVIVV